VVKLQEELSKMPSLGKYNFAGASQVQAIRAEVEKLEAEIGQLKADKQAAEAINQKLRDDVDAYLAKHSKK
jgi:outer membrane murein-binding lipoprotein Lpp